MSTPQKKTKSGFAKKKTTPRKRVASKKSVVPSVISKTNKLEVHFQDGFYKDTLTIAQHDTTLMTAQLTTRMQTGLAAIETIEFSAGAPLEFRLPEKQIYQTTHVPDDIQLIRVTLENHQLIIQPMTHHPGYL